MTTNRTELPYALKPIISILFVFIFMLVFVDNTFGLDISNGYANTMACNGTLYDPGGTGNYANSQSGYTIIPGKPGATISISGTYNTELNYDYVYIYSGVGIGGTYLYRYSGSGSVNYTAPVGQSVTVRFTSDGGVVGAGFQFNITYSTGGTCPSATQVTGTSGSVSCGTSTLLLDHAGDANYSNSRNDYIVLNSIGTAAINIWGAYATESSYDYVRIYNGSGIGGTLLAQYSGDGVINYTGTAGQTLTLRFTSDGNTIDGGFSFIASTIGSCSIPYEATYQSMSTGSSTWCVGETRNVSVTIKNTGTNSWTDGAGEDFNIGVKWNADPDYLVRVDAQNLAPGATQTYTLSVTAPAAGSNNLTFNVVREGVAWFGGPYTSGAQTIIDKPVCATSTLSPGNGATGVCSNTVSSISWAAVSGATSYDVYFGTSTSPPLASTSQAGNSYATGALTPSQTYYWRVVPKNSCGSATGCSTYSFTTAAPIGTPTANAATSVSCNSFTANWGAVSGATSYRLDVSTSSGFGSFVSGYNNLTVSGTAQSVTGLSNGVTYYYRVRAVNACNETSANSGTIAATTSAPANNVCGTATALTINGGATTGNVTCASAGSGPCNGTANYDVWYSFTTTCSGTYQVFVDPSSSFDAVFQLYSSCGGSNISPISGTAGTDACVDYGSENSNEYATYSLSAGATYYVRVYDYNSSGSSYPSTTDFTIAVTTVSIAVPAQPSAISGPSSICTGSTATYAVTNVAGITYNWSLPAGWSGSSTTNSITIGTNNTSGTITVTATNVCGSSSPRTLTVSAGVIPAANAGNDATVSCAGAIKLGASSNPEIIATEDFGNSNTEVTSTSTGWRIKYLVGSSPGNRTEWWISNATNGFSCAVGGSSLAQFDTYSQYGPIKCDYAWDDGTMDEVAYRLAEVDASLYTKVYLTFDYLVSGEVSGSTVYDYMQVVYSTDGGNNWTPVNAGLNSSGTYTLNANRGVNNGYFSSPPTPSPVNTTIELPSALAGTKFLFGFRWYNDGATGYIPGMVIDNIIVSGTADYSWSGANVVFGADTKTPVVNQPGTYTVTVTAGNGCTASDQLVVTQGELSADASATNGATCNAPGFIDITNPAGGDQSWVVSSLTSAPANTSLVGNASYTGGMLRLTPASGSQAGSFVVGNPNSFNAGALDLEFDMYIGGGSAADGFSLSYAGDIPANPGGSESGHGTGLIVSFDSYSNGAGGYQYGGSNQQGIYLVYNGTVLAFNAGASWRNAWHTVKLSINSSNQFSLYIDGVSALTYNLGTTGYAAANKTGWTWAFSARTGGAFDEHSIRNMLLTVYDQYEYSIGSGWGLPSSFSVGAGTYTPQIRLKGGVCTKNLTPQNISSTSLTIAGQTFQAGDFVFSGASTADWATAANWFVYNGSSFDVATVVPATTNNTFIYPASTHMCIVRSSVDLSGTNNTKDVNIKPGATMNGTVNTRTINVYGNWFNEGTYNMGNSTVAIVGAINTTVRAGGSSFYNVTVDKASNVAIVKFLEDFTCSQNFLLSRGTVEIPQDVVGNALNTTVNANGILVLRQKTGGAKGGEFRINP